MANEPEMGVNLLVVLLPFEPADALAAEVVWLISVPTEVPGRCKGHIPGALDEVEIDEEGEMLARQDFIGLPLLHGGLEHRALGGALLLPDDRSSLKSLHGRIEEQTHIVLPEDKLWTQLPLQRPTQESLKDAQ